MGHCDIARKISDGCWIFEGLMNLVVERTLISSTELNQASLWDVQCAAV